MSKPLPLSFQYYKLSLTIVMFSSLLLAIWGNFPFAPTIIKLIFSLSVWSALILYPWSWIKYNDFPKIGLLLLNSMLLWGVFEILRSLLGFSDSTNEYGNKYITLFFNEICALLFVPPLYAYTVSKYNILYFLFQITKRYIWGGLLVSLCSVRLLSLSRLSVYIVVFWKQVSLKNRIYLLIIFISAFIYAILGARVFYIFLAYSFVAYFFCYKIPSKLLQKITCIISVIFPLISFLPLFSTSAQSDDSNFKKILNYVNDVVGGGDDLKVDTRTFLYLEMATDLSRNNAWLLGKGANSTYYSQYFSEVQDGDNCIRITVEVPVLLFLLRGGLIYVFLYLSFFLLCIYKSVWKGRSSFLNCIGIMLAGWFANLFVGDVSGCSFYHLIFFSLCGLTLSTKWLNKTDVEIKKLINTQSLMRI